MKPGHIVGPGGPPVLSNTPTALPSHPLNSLRVQTAGGALASSPVPQTQPKCHLLLDAVMAPGSKLFLIF